MLNLPECTLTEEIIEKYDALIFDMDGTIIDTLPAHMRAWEETGQKYGFTVYQDVIRATTGAHSSQIAQAVLKANGMDPELYKTILPYKFALAKIYIAENSDALPAFDLVKMYKGRKPIGLGTGSTQEFLDVLLDKFHFREYFGDAIVTADDVTKHKPDPETFVTVAQRLGVDPQRCLVFEDGEFGVRAALACGMDAYHVDEHKLYKSELSKIK